MTLEDKNQKDILNTELVNSLNIDYTFGNKPINRFKIKPKEEDKSQKLNDLKEDIRNIDSCVLKKNSSNLVFNGNKKILDKLKINLNLRPQNLDFEPYYKLTVEYENLRS